MRQTRSAHYCRQASKRGACPYWPRQVLQLCDYEVGILNEHNKVRPLWEPQRRGFLLDGYVYIMDAAYDSVDMVSVMESGPEWARLYRI